MSLVAGRKVLHEGSTGVNLTVFYYNQLVINLLKKISDFNILGNVIIIIMQYIHNNNCSILLLLPNIIIDVVYSYVLLLL